MLATPIISVAGLEVEGQAGFRLDVPQFVVDRPGITVIVGANGSGKSTFLDALLDLLQARAGDIRLFGSTLAKLPARHAVRFAIGAQVQGVSWSWSIKVAEIMAIHRELYGTVDESVLERLAIAKLAPLLYRKLSTGQRRRVDLAVALAHRPSLIVLDEPTSGLDRRFEDAYRQVVAERRAAGASMLIASHDPIDIESADRIIWFKDGRVIEDDVPDVLVHRIIGEHVCSLEQPGEAAAQVVERVAPLANFHHHDERGIMLAGSGTLRAAFLEAVAALEVPGFAVRPARAGDLLTVFKVDAAGGHA